MGRGLLLIALLLAGLVRSALAEPEDWLDRKTLGFEVAPLDRGRFRRIESDYMVMRNDNSVRLDADRLDGRTVVAFVFPGVPLSGIVPGTLIVSLAGKRIDSLQDWDNTLAQLPAGSEVSIEFRPMKGKRSGPRQTVQVRVLTGREAARSAVRIETDSVTGMQVARFGHPTEFADDSDAPLQLQFSIDEKNRVVPYLRLPRGWGTSLDRVVLSEQGSDTKGPFSSSMRVPRRSPDETNGLSDDRLLCVDNATLEWLGRSLKFAVAPPPSLVQPQFPTGEFSLQVCDVERCSSRTIQSREAAAFRAVLRAYQAYGGRIPPLAAGTPSPITMTRPIRYFGVRE